MPAWLASPRKSNRQRPCGQIAEAMPTAVAGQVEGPALLDVELDERADAGEPFGVGADGVRVVPGALHGLRAA